MAAVNPEPMLNSDPADAPRAASIRNSFYMMGICFGLNHAAVTTPVSYASALLGNDVGQASNATLYGVCMLSALFVGPLLGGTLGPKWTMLFGMVCYCAYTILFAVASSVDQGSPPAWSFAVGGSFVGGIGAGTLWVGQGGFFAAICQQLSEAAGVEKEQVTSELASIFAVFYLGQECFWKVLFTILQKYIGMTNLQGFGLYGILALAATLVLAFVQDYRTSNAQARPGICAKASAAVSLWSDPKIWLISGNNIAFGFAAAYLNGYINGHWQEEALGSGDLIGFLGAIICLIATISSKFYGWLSSKLNSKMPIVLFGSLCFILIGVLSFISAPNGKGPGGWGWGILIFYILHGLGRGVYESTNKGVFADTFPGERGMAAFANAMMQNTFSSTVGFVLGVVKFEEIEVYILLLFAIITVPGLYLAKRMQEKEKKTSDAGANSDAQATRA